MRILITGAGGLVGRNVAEALSGLHELFTPPRSKLDLRDYAVVEDYIGRYRPEMVIHCAGTVGGIQANINEPVRFLVDNLDVGRNVVMAARARGIERLINLGSSCMYPRNAPNPLREEDVLRGELEPTNEGYAIAKVAIQRLCSYVVRERPECRFKTLMPCNLYGRWDSFDPERSHMIPAVIRKLHLAKNKGTRGVQIWGSGKARREFMYAGDFAAFIAYAIPRFDEMPDLLNVGLGCDYSVDEYYEKIASVIGFEGGFTHDPSKPEGMDRKLEDVTKLAAFGWKAPTSLIEGLRKTYEFYLEHGGTE